jgi:membrane fusion protein (multidrug efflux system)
MPPDPPEKPEDRERAEGRDQTGADGGAQPKKKPFRRKRVLIGGGLVLAVAVIAGFVWWLHARNFEVTDDAYIDGDIVYVAPQIAGRVVRVWVTDNQLVGPGQPLVDIDPADPKARVEQAKAQAAQAEAQIGQAQAQIRVNQATLQQAQANIAANAAQAADAAKNLARYQQVRRLNPTAVSQQQLDQALATAQNTAAQTEAARKQAAAARNQIELAQAQIHQSEAQLAAAKAQIDQAQINLGYTRIYADVAGHVTHRTVTLGNFVQPGQQLLAITPLNLWVTANYKETQLDLMRVGQPVSIRIDAYPGRSFRGHVDSFSHGAGQAFALLPPQNATGNFVKVVQRVPVKIVFDDRTAFNRPLGPGMSVVPRVKVR